MLKFKPAVLALAGAVAAASLAPAALATTITRDFVVNVTSGPLTDTSSSGSFSYDSSSIPGGGQNNGTDLLTALDFTFNGITYDAATANTGALVFNPDGSLLEAFFGNSCQSGSCNSDGSTNDWFIVGPQFAYNLPSSPDGFGGTVTYPAIAAPEPAVLGMFGLGLLLVGGFASLRRRPLRGA